jgi:hypothetical protein
MLVVVVVVAQELEVLEVLVEVVMDQLVMV